MEIAIIVGITLLNVLISWWNARVCGQVWAETKVLGGFIRLVVWSAAIMSAIGFSSAVLLGLVVVVVMSLGNTPETLALVKFATSLWYVMVIIPVLSTGLIITIHSWIEAYRERSLLNMGVAAWNTFAQIHNTADAVSSMVPAMKEGFSGISGSMDGDDAKSKVVILGMAIVLVALLSGALITAMIIKRYEGTLPLPERATAAG